MSWVFPTSAWIASALGPFDAIAPPFPRRLRR
jgi:hypothetical protein